MMGITFISSLSFVSTLTFEITCTASVLIVYDGSPLSDGISFISTLAFLVSPPSTLIQTRGKSFLLPNKMGRQLYSGGLHCFIG